MSIPTLSAIALHPLTWLVVRYRTANEEKRSFYEFAKATVKNRDSRVLTLAVRGHEKQFNLPEQYISLLLSLGLTIVLSIFGFFFHGARQPTSFCLAPSPSIVNGRVIMTWFYTYLSVLPLALVYRTIDASWSVPESPVQIDFKIREKLYVLLKNITTETERTQWFFFDHPGIQANLAAQIVVELLILPSLKASLWHPPYASILAHMLAVLLEAGRLALGAALLTPLHVSLTRLLIQRYTGPVQPVIVPRSTTEEESDETDLALDSTTEDPSASGMAADSNGEVPEESAPMEYTGLIDCLTKMHQEQSLYRCWWLVLLQLCLSSHL